MDEKDIAIAEMKKEIGSLKHRMNDVERIVDAVHTLALEMARQTEEIKHMNESIARLNREVAELKAKPAHRWEILISAVIGAVVSTAASIFFEGR